MARMTQRRKIHRFRIDDTGTGYPASFKEDLLAAEEPLEIRLNGTSFAVTMRTPGDDFDLVAGFLVSEGVVRHASELISLRFCAGTRDGEQTFNVVDAQLHSGVALPDTKRNVFTSSSCGICGIESIDAVRPGRPPCGRDRRNAGGFQPRHQPERLQRPGTAGPATSGGCHAHVTNTHYPREAVRTGNAGGLPVPTGRAFGMPRQDRAGALTHSAFQRSHS